MNYTLAIDQGTHASRALVFDDQGQTVSAHLLPVALTRPQPHRAEQDAGRILAGVREVTDTALRALTAGQRRSVSACGITTQRSTVLAWRHDGAPVSPALSWQDTRGTDRVAALKPRAGRIRRLSGLPLSPHYGASKLHWLNSTYGSDDGLRLGPLASFLLHNLANGEHCLVDHSNAQRMQLLDIHACRWSPELLDWFDVPVERLPACRPVIDDYGRLAGSDIPVTAVCGDQNAAWFGNGRPDEATALVNLGSGAFVLAARPKDNIAAELLTSIAVSRAQGCQYLAEGTVNGAGSALQWLQARHAGSDIIERLPQWLAREPSPPLFLNSVGGLGSPWWEDRMEPVFSPDTDSHTLAAQAVAVAESILFLVRANLDLLQRDCRIKRLRVSGGLSRITPLCQKLADLADLPVMRSDASEASARGVAWLAAGQPADWPADDSVQLFRPRPDSGLSDRYRRFRAHLQQRLESCTHD
jgi:glycerol kinase